MNPFNKIHGKVLDSSLIIVAHLNEGNEKSKKMGRILRSMINVFKRNPNAFDTMRKELQDSYSRLSEIHNKRYQELGGQLGSGEFIEKDIDDVPSEYSDSLDGVSPEGFNLLQSTIPGLNVMMRKVPMDAWFIERLLFAHWITLMSLHDAFEMEEVIKIVTKYDVNFS